MNTPTRNRFDDALEIQEGACNVLAIANALVRACWENHNEKDRTTFENDPAIKLIVHQLTWLCLHTDTCSTHDWLAWKAACNERRLKT